MDPMLGMIFMIPWNWAPNGYQLCQGQTLSLQQYEGLYSLMGITFGGNGSSNFVLPNLQGRAPVGIGQLVSGNSTYYTLGASGGSEQTTLSGLNLPIHSHGATFTSTGGGTSTPSTATGTVSLPFSTTATLPATVSGTVNLAVNAMGGTNTPSEGAALARPSNSSINVYTAAATAGALGIGGSQTLAGTAAGTISGTAAGNVTLSVTGGSSGGSGTVTVANAGGSTPFSTMQPYLAMSFIIAVLGIYPDRP